MSESPGATWERLVELTFRQRVAQALFAVAPIAVVAYSLFQIPRIFLPELPLWALLLIGLACGFGGLALFAVVYALLRPALMVDFSRKQLRLGRKVFDFASVNTATLLVTVSSKKERHLSLKFGVEHGPTMSVPLFAGTAPSLSAESRERLLTVLRESDIHMPVDKYDPTGKFARFNYPENLTKEAAIGVVLAPPDPDERLPVG